ncbi:MAG: amidohydrolase, partial [Chitinophagaceae bacterium]
MKKLLLLSCLFVLVQGIDAQLRQKINSAIAKVEPKCIAWREQLHQYPELGNREFKTAKLVADQLRLLGIEVKEGVAKTGVVGILRGDKPGPCIALRADMDALPVTEHADIPFASKEKTNYNGQEVGVMHACGHDTHVAMLLSVAEVLSGIKKDLKGTVKFIFQPAEEGPPNGEEGGAKLMVEEGVMDNPKVDVVFGLHMDSELPTGKLGYKPAGFMASACDMKIIVKGTGAHGAYPWKGVDPILTAAEIVTALQSIVSRNVNLTQNPAVITIGAFNGGNRFNQIIN